LRRSGLMATVVIAVIGIWCCAADEFPRMPPERPRQIQSFDADWRFFKGDRTRAQSGNFDDASWRKLDVPHDWSIEGPFDRNNPAGGAGAFLPAGIGWYRKHFNLSADQSSRRAFIEFDGVMANSDVWINGFHLGHRPYGYVTFRYELTGHLNYGADRLNVLAVRVDDSQQPASRWYAGAGIYRHVRMILTDPVHFALSSTFLTTPSIGKANATVHVRSTVMNQSASTKSVSVGVALIAPDGREAGATAPKLVIVPAGKSVDVDEETTVPAVLWDLTHANLYTAIVSLGDGKQTIDDDVCTFGIRQAVFEADTGFWLNGQNIKLKGVCLHSDLDGLGTAVPLRGWQHRLAALKRIGCNAIRTSHNPVAPEFLDLCDRMGFLVMDEMFDCWTVPKNPYDYSQYFRDWSLIDLRDTVERDRNHPCIVLYSAGNEIHDTPHADIAIPILKSLVQAFHETDPTRPVTQALFRPNRSHDFQDGLADLLDVVGVNYRYHELLAAHDAKPSLKIIGTENSKDLKAWASVRDNAPNAGEFLWAGADYLGESRAWPGISRENGLLDLSDRPRPIAFQLQSWWSDQPMVALARFEGEAGTGNDAGEPQMRAIESADWTPSDSAPHDEKVRVYSNAQQVELTLNGQSLGSQDRHPDQSDRMWTVHYQPGTLRAVARNDNSIVATDELRTAGTATKVVLSTDHAQLAPVWNDISFITAAVVDASGVCQPHSGELIRFQIDGPGKLAAVENGDVNSTEPFQSTQRSAYHGICTAIIRATSTSGKIRLTASAAGLEAGWIEIDTVPDMKIP
jgi:beta-galactosidase